MKNLLVIFALLMAFTACGRRHDGANGLNGTSGSNGVDGLNSLVAMASGAASCANGGVTVFSGLDANRNNVLDALEVTASADVCNGDDGTNGSNGSNGTNGTNGADAPPTAFTPVALVNPCGDAPGIYDEIFLKLQNGTLIASFSANSSGLNTRFSVLTAGSYQTTDGDNCTFNLDAAGNISGENHHF